MNRTKDMEWRFLSAFIAISMICGCGPREDSLEQGRECRSLRHYEDAKTAFQHVLDRQPENMEALVEMAGLCQETQEWSEARNWWARVLELNSDDNDALMGYWQSLWEAADSVEWDSIAGLIVTDLEARIPEATDRLTILSLAVDVYAMINDSAKTADIRNVLVGEYPNSQKAYDILGEDFYEGLYPIWRDDEAKIEYLLEFIREQPKTVWRRTAYEWLLYSLHETGRNDSLIIFCKINANEFRDDPFALTQSARWLLEIKQEVELAWKYAQTAVELERVAVRPDFYPEEQWKLEKAGLFGNSRLMLAKAYREMGELDHAEKGLRAAIDEAPYTVDDDKNSSAHWEMLAEILMKKKRYEEAFDAAVHCLIGGDRRNIWSTLADSVLVEACNNLERDPDERMNLARDWVGYHGPVFTDVTETAGLGERWESRVAWGDVDNDGDDDLLLGGRALLINQGNGTFSDNTEAAEIKGSASGGVFGDYDDDGWLDFYAISSGSEDKADRLWRNRGDGSFEDVTVKAGNVFDDVSSEGAAWGDFNGDGYLDLYVANYEKPGEDLGQGIRDRFYLNQGDGTFQEVADSMGMTPAFGRHLCGRGVNWGDYDNDDDQDIFVSNYRLQENLLWENMEGKRAANAALRKGIAGVEHDGWWGHTIGSEWGDYDNDGDLDLITANLAHPRYIDFSNKTCLYENQGAPDWTFVNCRSEAGIKYEETHSDPAWGDVDNDGFLDLYITCIYQNMRSFLYRNRGDGTFEDVTYMSGTRAFNGWGCAFSDYDIDGDLDLLVASGSGVKLFRNDSPSKHWLQVKVFGTKSNRVGIGARVEISQGNRRQNREIQGGKGTTSQHSLVAHFGLGDDTTPVKVVVRFSSESVKTVENVTVNQRIEVVE